MSRFRVCAVVLVAASAMACAHVPAPAPTGDQHDGKAPVATAFVPGSPAPPGAQHDGKPPGAAAFVPGSRIRQPVDPATGLPRTFSPTRVYSRQDIDGTGRPFDMRSALRDLDPGF